jgi:hypothetical protein
VHLLFIKNILLETKNSIFVNSFDAFCVLKDREFCLIQFFIGHKIEVSMDINILSAQS